MATTTSRQHPYIRKRSRLTRSDPVRHVPLVATATTRTRAPLDSSELNRLRKWARGRGHPYYLWPDVPIPAWRAALEGIASAVAGWLSRGPPVALTLSRGVDARALGIAAFTSGLGPLLGYWLETGDLIANDDIRMVLARHLRAARDRWSRTEQLAAQALAALAETGISPLVVKGGHTALAHFPNPAARPMTDLDIVVEGESFARGGAVLEALGFEPIERRRDPLKVSLTPPGERLGPVSLELTHADNPWAIELHASLARSFFRVRTIDLGPPRVARARRFGVEVRVLEEPWLTAHLALHASEELHRLPMLRLLELALVMRAGCQSGLDWDELGSLLARNGAERFAFPAFELAERLAPGLIEPGFRERLTRAAPARMRRVVGGLGPASAQRLASVSVAEKLMWARGPWELTRRVSDLFWPTGAHSSPGALPAILAQRAWRLLRGGLRLSPSRE